MDGVERVDTNSGIFDEDSKQVCPCKMREQTHPQLTQRLLSLRARSDDNNPSHPIKGVWPSLWRMAPIVWHRQSRERGVKVGDRVAIWAGDT
jgi:hypothetical protein